jgi:hypothetical protein
MSEAEAEAEAGVDPVVPEPAPPQPTMVERITALEAGAPAVPGVDYEALADAAEHIGSIKDMLLEIGGRLTALEAAQTEAAVEMSSTTLDTGEKAE